MTEPKKGYKPGVYRLVSGAVDANGDFSITNIPKEGYVAGIYKLTEVTIDDNGDTSSAEDDTGISRGIAVTVDSNGDLSETSSVQEGYVPGIYRVTTSTNIPKEGLIDTFAAVSGTIIAGVWSGAVIPDMHDDFTEAGDTELDLHVVDPLPVAAPPTWLDMGGNFSLKVNNSNEVVLGADTVGTWAAYAFETGVVPSKIQATLKNASTYIAGFMIRTNSDGSAGVYVELTTSTSKIAVAVKNYANDAVLGSGDITGINFTDTYLSMTVEDLGTELKIYPTNTPSNSVTATTSLNNTLTHVGVYGAGNSVAVGWKDFKVYFSEAAAINAANFPSGASVFDMTTSSVSGDTATDVAASPSLSYTTDAGEGLHSDGTLHGIGVNDPYNNFNESDVDVASALDSPDAASPIVLVCTGKWSGGTESYARSLGYGDWKAGNGDTLYVGARNQTPSVDLQAELYGDQLATPRIVSANHASEVTFPIDTPKWFSHLVVIDPTVCRITHYLISEDDETVRSSTSTTTALTLPFTFQAGEAHVTWHKVYTSFMGLFYPDIVPTAEEAENILTYHYRNHIANKKHLHPWFESRAKYS